MVQYQLSFILPILERRFFVVTAMMERYVVDVSEKSRSSLVRFPMRRQCVCIGNFLQYSACVTATE